MDEHECVSRNLTTMREQLEQLQSSGQAVTEDTLNSIGHAMENIGQAVGATSDTAHPNGSAVDGVESSENDGSHGQSATLNETQSEPILGATTDDGDDGELEHDQVGFRAFKHLFAYGNAHCVSPPLGSFGSFYMYVLLSTVPPATCTISMRHTFRHGIQTHRHRRIPASALL
jgi:hypothetical protein